MSHFGVEIMPSESECNEFASCDSTCRPYPPWLNSPKRQQVVDITDYFLHPISSHD